MATVSLPLSPQQTRSDRPRAVSTMSHASTHSHKSSRSRDEKKLELIETSKDKRRLEGFSDPTKALKVAEPAAVALEDSNLENLREAQYKDRDGNMILDPDRSNPTRPRLERPLDTIRAFNAAAEGTTSRRSSYQRPQSQYGSQDQQMKRLSYYGQQGGRHGPRQGPPNNGYYNRQSQYGYSRPEPFVEEGEGMQSDNMRQQSRFPAALYPVQQQQEAPSTMRRQQHSYETMTSGSDELSKSTNPSSENSSFDQLHQTSQRKFGTEPATNPYRQSAHARTNMYPPSAYQNGPTNRPSGPTDDYGMDFESSTLSSPPPPPPKHQWNSSAAPGPSTGGGRLQKTTSNSRPEPPNKRQSWIKRTFSKRG